MPDEAQTMICVCGGDYRPTGVLFGQATVFDSYYDTVLKKDITSYRGQEKAGKNFRSKDHPEGLVMLNDNKKLMKEMKNISRHKEDYKAANNPGYKPGQKQYDSTRPDYYGRKSRMYFYNK